MSKVLAVIGGSGLYAIEGLSDVGQVELSTPYGAPSAAITRGRLGETTLLFLPRHGTGHRLSPTEVNYRANICALKQLGATHLVSVSAVGSLREALHPGDVVVVDQYIDRTLLRARTFFEGGIVAHVSLADPVCPILAKSAANAARRAGANVHVGGTYICIEGPQFSTRAESLMYRSFQADVIGMTAMPEARLAREAELPYVTLAFVTDYDCWHQSEEAVSVEQVVAVLQQNAKLARQMIVELARDLDDPRKSPAYYALRNAIITESTSVTTSNNDRLSWLLDARH
jgi:5'-methylthioadenosine phosphorylase